MADDLRINRVDLALLEIRDGDVVVVSIPDGTSMESAQRLARIFKEALAPLPNPVVVVERSVELEVLARRVAARVYNTALDDAVEAIDPREPIENQLTVIHRKDARLRLNDLRKELP